MRCDGLNGLCLCACPPSCVLAWLYRAATPRSHRCHPLRRLPRRAMVMMTVLRRRRLPHPREPRPHRRRHLRLERLHRRPHLGPAVAAVIS